MDGIIKTIEKTKNILYQYKDELPIGIGNYYLEILDGINIEHLMHIVEEKNKYKKV